MNKYRNKTVVVGNERFDSKREANRWVELQLMERAGLISDLRRQVTYELIPTQRGEDGSVIERSCSYKADFVYVCNGIQVVEDCKGMRTAAYIIKRKLMLKNYGIRIKET